MADTVEVGSVSDIGSLGRRIAEATCDFQDAKQAPHCITHPMTSRIAQMRSLKARLKVFKDMLADVPDHIRQEDIPRRLSAAITSIYKELTTLCSHVEFWEHMETVVRVATQQVEMWEVRVETLADEMIQKCESLELAIL